MEVWIRPSWYYLGKSDAPMPFPVPGHMWDRALGQRLYADHMAFARRVDELGFDGLIFTEHHYSPNGGLTPSPVVLLAATSQVTERIKLVTLGIPLALYPHPVRVAEELAMADNLSRGRLVVGLISGGATNLYAYNLPPREERSRQREAYDLIVKAWTEENPFEWHGQHYDYRCVSILPRPLQTPHPPIWTVAASAESLQWAARHRVRLVTSGSVTQAVETITYYRTYAEAECGWSPSATDLAIAREFYIASATNGADAMGEGLFERVGESTFTAVAESPQLAELHREVRSERTYGHLSQERTLGNRRTANAIESGQFLVGNPESMTEQILRQREASGAGVLIIRPELGGLSLESAAEGLELFAREVLPVVQKA